MFMLVRFMALRHQGKREGLLTYVYTLYYTVLKHCEIVVGFGQGKM
jgi:hypothetical protein